MFCVNPLMPRFRSLFVAFRRPKKAAEAEAPASLQGGEQSRVFPPGRDGDGTAATAPPAREAVTRYGRLARPIGRVAPAGHAWRGRRPARQAAHHGRFGRMGIGHAASANVICIRQGGHRSGSSHRRGVSRWRFTMLQPRCGGHGAVGKPLYANSKGKARPPGAGLKPADYALINLKRFGEVTLRQPEARAIRSKCVHAL